MKQTKKSAAAKKAAPKKVESPLMIKTRTAVLAALDKKHARNLKKEDKCYFLAVKAVNKATTQGAMDMACWDYDLGDRVYSLLRKLGDEENS